MDLTKTEIKFQMPAGNVTFKATYLTIEKFEIYVVDGTKDKSPAKAGETITITANPAKEGKVFDKWTCETAGVTIVFESATSSTTTFVMPACEITPPAKKDGLSGGQVAGIVIGTLLLAGIGGFAVLWFAIKKKTFADLGVVLKKGFTAIGNFFKNLGAKIKSLFTKEK